MRVVADLEVHSRFSRAVSPQMTLPNIALWAKKKGIDLVGSGDFTHPVWFSEIKSQLSEIAPGIYGLDSTNFLLTAEVSSIFSQNGRGYRVHTMIFAPDIATVEKINTELLRRGCNLAADGRPIIGLSCKNVAELVLSLNDRCLILPAHVWTPWFGFYGDRGGFDSLDDGFGEFAKNIFAVETGMSSDPAMNWRIRELDNRSIVSFGDAHSLPNLGREATVFDLEKVTFENIRRAIVSTGNRQLATRNQIVYTIEFFPEEGKYHYTGHRACQVVHSVQDTQKLGTSCPACGRPLTVGVVHRVEKLAGRSQEDLKLVKKDLPGTKIQGVYSGAIPKRPPYVRLVPLDEILAEVFDVGAGTQKVAAEYEKLIAHFGNEFSVLLQADLGEVGKLSGAKTAEAIDKVRKENISIDPGYDGVYGRVKIWEEKLGEGNDVNPVQISLLDQV